MASTEPGPRESLRTPECLAKAAAPTGAIRPLTADDLQSALALSASARWNQNEADWAMMLALGRGWGIDAVDGAASAAGKTTPKLAATTVVLPYGDRFAWISMVLVLPQFQRRGFATQLLRHALAELSSRGTTAVLDATPAGRAVYARQGFNDAWGFARYRRECSDSVASDTAGSPMPQTRPLRESDWPAIEAMDRPAFGASRLSLLRALAQRLPRAARVAEEAGHLRGFVFGRDGRETSQIGPLLADNDTTATNLVAAVLHELPGPVHVDLLNRRQAMLPWLQKQGFALQRPFTRMVHGGSVAPGVPAPIVFVAGPELG